MFKLLDFHKSRISYAVFDRHVDVFDKKRIQTMMKSKYPPVFFKKQMHGTDFHIVSSISNEPAEGDILITQQRQIPLVVRVADCSGIIIFDPVQKAIANIHAGWKGISRRAIHMTVKTLMQKIHSLPKNLIACISPMLGVCCSKFSNPRQELPIFMHKYIGEEDYVDLWAAVEGQLKECGIPPEQIENPRICTFCNPETYNSHRRDGESGGRFGTAIMLK